MNDIAPLHSPRIAHAIAHAILEGFNKHYRIFREVAQQAKAQFERGGRRVSKVSVGIGIAIARATATACSGGCQYEFVSSQSPPFLTR